jgi:hypothetical protein
MNTTIGWLLAAALLVAGCADVQGAAIGRPVAAKPPGCAISEARVTPKEAQDRYEQIGVICYTRTQEVNDECTVGPGKYSCRQVRSDPKSATLIDDVRTEACRLGGEIVVRQGLCNLRDRPGIEVGVYIARPLTPTLSPPGGERGNAGAQAPADLSAAR